MLGLHAGALDVAEALLAFASRHRSVLWPGYTHQRRAMPSSVGLWAGAYAEGVLDTAEALAGLWPVVDRSPLGSAAGYGVPLPLKRETAARALGFAGVDRNVATVQGGPIGYGRNRNPFRLSPSMYQKSIWPVLTLCQR